MYALYKAAHAAFDDFSIHFDAAAKYVQKRVQQGWIFQMKVHFPP